MLTPSSNTTLEPATGTLIGDLGDLSVHYSRFRVTHIDFDDDGLRQFDDEPMLAASALLADARVHAIVWNGTSGGWLGAARDERLCRTITAKTSVPATTVTLTLLSLLKRCGAERIAFITPYRREVQARILDNFEATGFTCVDIEPFGLSDNFSFSGVAAQALDQRVELAAQARPDVIIPFCTNMPATRHIVRWESEYGIPVLESTALALRGGLDLIGRPTTDLIARGRLFAL